MRKIEVIGALAFVALALLFFIVASSATEIHSLTKLPKLDNASVDPEGSETWNQAFNYSVKCNFSKAVNITLEVYDLSLYDWWEPDINGTCTYNEPGKWQELTWNNIRICSDKCVGTSRYRFKYNRIVLKDVNENTVHYGPTISPPPTPTMFKNATLAPSIGEYNTLFYYSVEPVYVNRSGIKLVVFNPHTLEEGIFEKPIFKNSRLKWSIKPFENDFDCKGIAEYYFKYDGQRWPETVPFSGPIINLTGPAGPSGPAGPAGPPGPPGWSVPDWKEEIGKSNKPLKKPIITCNVTPTEERWFKKFTYIALIKRPDRVNMSVALFVYKPGSNDWELVPWKLYKDNAIIREEDYENGDATVKWVSEGFFDENDVNKHPYEYYIWYYDGYNEGNVYFTGPEDVTANHEPSVNGSVTPETGTIWTPFKYTAYINDKDGDDTVFISLYVKDPSNKTVLIGEKTVTIKDGNGTATWVVPSDEYPERIFTTENMGNKSFNSSFYFGYSDEGMVIMGIGKNTSDTLPGPNVKPANVTVIRATVTPETGKYSDKFTYNAEFYSSESNTITATLRIYDPSNLSEYKNFITKDVNGTGYIYILWQEVSPDVFGPGDFNKTSKYSIVWRDKRLQMKEKEEGPWDGPQINKGIPIVGGVALPVTLIIVVPLVIPSMLFLSPFFRKKREEKIRKERRGKEEWKIKKEEEIKWVD